MRVLILVYIIFSITHTGDAQTKTRWMVGCDKRSCYPATGNLLIGREDMLFANDTCGLQGEERYCIISSLDARSNKKTTKCAMCDSSKDEDAHEVSKIVHHGLPHGAPKEQQNMTWWQATTGRTHVNITLNLEAEFHVTHVIITFKTFRPAAMFIEKSYDWGKNWTIHRYFSADCAKDFPGVTIGVPNYLNESVCQGRYSRITPSSGGEIIYRVLPPNIKFNSPNFDPYSKQVQELLKTTNLRLTFTRLHTLGDDNLLDDKEEVMWKYYYAIQSMVVRGSCSCYGHASECVHAEERHKDIDGMVHGTCKCEHNTQGNNCEYCKPFYQDWPWRPAYGKKKNECKKCSCNEHTDTCHFDDRIFSASGNTTGGVCDNCLHNTEGTHCEYCQASFYHDPSKPITDLDTCLACNCDIEGTDMEETSCVGEGEEDGKEAGQCYCKTHVGGLQCDRCSAGFWNFTTENPDGCQQCTCNIHGTVQSEDGGCDETTGACTCKRNVAQVRDCDQCLPEHYGLSEAEPLGCKKCDCDPGGAYNNNCDVNTGQCMCRPNIKGRRCDVVEDFYYTGPLDYLLFEGELAEGTNKLTNPVRKKPSAVPGQTTWTNFGYMQVFEGSNLTFYIQDIWRTMDYFPIIRYEHDPSHPTDWDKVTVQLERMDAPGGPDPSGPCASAVDTMEVSLLAGQLHTTEKLPFCLESGQRYKVKLIFNQWAPANPTQGAKILIDSITLLPDIADIPFLNVPSCSNDEFLCGDQSTCIPTGKTCDGIKDCPGGEDEVECSGVAPDDGESSGDEDSGSGSGVGSGSGDDSNSTAEIDPTESWLHPNFIADISGGRPKEDRTDQVSTKGWYPGDEIAQANRDKFDSLGCKEHFLQPKPSRAMDAVPDECMKILKSISFLTFQGAHQRPCNCDSTGSSESMCDKYYGGCTCKNLVVGRRCDSCAPAAYGFSSYGCERCECHGAGSQDEFCNQQTGQCTCNTQQPTFGRKCDECKPGYWNFPDCRQCECNGHADICHPQTGECINCRDSTMGSFCDQCRIGYYGRPEFGQDQVPCRECMCPNTKASGHSFAWDNTCDLDPTTGSSVCHCEDGYTGDKCDLCMDNFFGHPELAGQTCSSCDCSQNWIEDEEGNCDRHTGECLKCVYDTEGWNCEHCKAGWWGDAVNNQCRECACDELGTDRERFACDRITGRCNCLPNVQGEHCSECIENHWKIAMGVGCEPCACDNVGSTGESCDLYEGQCECRPGFGGRQCNECEKDFWGDPQKQCVACNCNINGVDPNNPQCDTTTGKCHCMQGIGGDKCDECAPGFVHEKPLTPDHPVNKRIIPSGERPNCQPCGECFDNWNRILDELQSNTTQRVAEAETVKVTGAAGAYTARFNSMESSIEEVNNIISKSSLKNEELDRFTEDINQIEDALQATTDRSKELDTRLAETEQSILQGNYNLTQLRQDADGLQRQANSIRDKATKLQEANVAGALKLTKSAAEKSEKAAKQVEEIAEVLEASDKLRGATEVALAKKNQQGIAMTAGNNTADLKQVTDEIRRLEERIPNLNKAVCDGDTTVDDPCDDLCGGAGCGKCGDVSCGEGALTKAHDAVTDAKEAEKILMEKHLRAEEAFDSINAVHRKVQESAELAQAARDKANEAKTRSQTESDRVDELTKQIDDFLGAEHATPEQVKEVARQCLDSEMTMDAAQIKALADQINAATDSVKNVDAINQETAAPLTKATSLKTRADAARDMAAAQLARAETVTKSLGDAEDAQSVAEAAIDKALADISTARADLGFIESEMQDATRISGKTFTDTQQLMVKQKALQTAYISNENHVKKAQTAADSAKTQAYQANQDLYQLNSKFKQVSESLTQKEGNIGSAKDQALSLQRRANKLSNSASQKLADLLDMEKQYEDNQKELETLEETLTNMNCQMQIHLKVIQSKSAWYTGCSPPNTWQPEEDCACPVGQTEPQCSAL